MTGDPHQPDDWQRAGDLALSKDEPWAFMDCCIRELQQGSLSSDARERLASILERLLHDDSASRILGVPMPRGRKPTDVDADDWRESRGLLLQSSEPWRFVTSCLVDIRNGRVNAQSTARLAELLGQLMDDDAAPRLLGVVTSVGRELDPDRRLEFAAWDEILRRERKRKAEETASMKGAVLPIGDVERPEKRIMEIESLSGRDRRELQRDRALFGLQVRLLSDSELEILASDVRRK
jgi:hypothetical protein